MGRQAQRLLEAVGGDAQKAGGPHSTPQGAGRGLQPRGSRNPAQRCPCSAADAAVSDAHSEVGLQLDHQVRPLLPSGHHRPPVADLSPAPTSLCSRPQLQPHPPHSFPAPGSCCDPSLPLPCDLTAPPSGRLSQLCGLWLTFWCGGAAPGLMRTRASVDGPHAPRPLLHPPAKGAGERAPPPRPCRDSRRSPRSERGPTPTSRQSPRMQGADEESKSRDGTGHTGLAHSVGRS